MANTPPLPNLNALIPWVGMYTMPVRLFDVVLARGCNCLIHSESENNTVPQETWRAGARAAGLPYFDTYLSDADLDDEWLLGWIVKGSDEWNRSRTRDKADGTGKEDYVQDPTPYLNEIDRLHALNAAAIANGRQGKPICANADGPAITTALFEKPPYNGVKNNEVRVMRRLHGRFMDHYPVANTAANSPAEIARRPMWLPAQALQRMVDWMKLEAGRVAPEFYGCIMEAHTGGRRPLAVTPAQMHEQKDYVLGRKAFPYPRYPDRDGKQQVTRTLEVRPRVWGWWTGNGVDGPGWKWVAQTDAQAAAQTEITAELLGTNAPPGQPPPVEPPPVVVPGAVGREEFESLKNQVATLNEYVRADNRANEATLALLRTIRDAINTMSGD